MTTLAPDEELLTEGLSRDLATASLALARRFHAGGTMWVVSPDWEPHAHHVAVEFVHPVIVGKRALPAVALTEPDPVAQVRVASRPGDVVVCIAMGVDPRILDVMARTQAWGVESIWIGFGERPPPGSADHVLWVDSDDPMVPATGRFVLLYHLLWELTHVCFEHPGLLVVDDEDCSDEVCITCSDEGRLGEIVLAPESLGEPALVRTANGEEQVDVTLILGPQPGDLIVIHAGAALTRLSDAPWGVSHE